MTQEAKRELGRSMFAIALVLAVLAVLFFLPSACGRETPPQVLPDLGQISAHEFLELPAGTPLKELGEDCNTHGRAACGTDLCMNTKHKPGTGWICSETCTSTHDCPVDWKCRQVYPTRNGSLCIPPEDWTPKVAIARTDVPQ